MKRFGILALAFTFLTGAAVTSFAQDTPKKEEPRKRRRRRRLDDDTTRSSWNHSGGSSWPAQPYLHPPLSFRSRFPPAVPIPPIASQPQPDPAPLWTAWMTWIDEILAARLRPRPPKTPGRQSSRRLLPARCHGLRKRAEDGSPHCPSRGLPKRLATMPGCRLLAVTPLPDRRRASSLVKRIFASLDFA